MNKLDTQSTRGEKKKLGNVDWLGSYLVEVLNGLHVALRILRDPVEEERVGQKVLLNVLVCFVFILFYFFLASCSSFKLIAYRACGLDLRHWFHHSCSS